MPKTQTSLVLGEKFVELLTHFIDQPIFEVA
jgi:hypothetical protein